MKRIWDYISVRADYALSVKQVMTMVMSVMLVFHIFTTLFFATYGMYMMVDVNAVCTAMYVYCLVQVLKNKHMLLAFNLCYAEIILHAVLEEFFLGVDSGFALYIIAILPLGFYAAYNFDTRQRKLNPMIYVFCSTVAFCFTRFVIYHITPYYSYENKTLDKVMYLVNFFIVVTAIVLFFSTLLNQIRALEDLRMHQNKQLEELSKTDSLTGLANRRTIEERYAQAQLLKEGYALILGDIDDFKMVNDTYGHNVGDSVLQSVASVFRSVVREGDTVCRWGGEEILIFLPKCSLENAKDRAELILRDIRKMELKSLKQEVFHITMTLGVSVSTEAAEFSDIVGLADERLYVGKQNGKNQVV